MESIQRSPLADKVILIHRGALGDVLCAWQSAWALSRACPGARLVFAGAQSRLRWFEPLGFTACPPALRKALDQLHGGTSWPGELQGWKVLWFVVDRAPEIPSGGDVTFLRAVAQPDGVHDAYVLGCEATGSQSPQAVHVNARSRVSEAGKQPSRAGSGATVIASEAERSGGPASSQARLECKHVRDVLASALARLGVDTPDGWIEDFRRFFAASRNPGREVLLFPGAGHPLKQWPLVQYFQLADRLAGMGFSPQFVLGPAELDRGMVTDGRAWVVPDSLEELERLLLGAYAVVGGDTGPMHLAGMLGVPGVALFGPTSFAQWGPVGIRELSLGLACSPCTSACRDLNCPEPRCLEDLSPDEVLEALQKVAPERKTGFQDPGIS